MNYSMLVPAFCPVQSCPWACFLSVFRVSSAVTAAGCSDWSTSLWEQCVWCVCSLPFFSQRLASFSLWGLSSCPATERNTPKPEWKWTHWLKSSDALRDFTCSYVTCMWCYVTLDHSRVGAYKYEEHVVTVIGTQTVPFFFCSLPFWRQIVAD